MERLAEVLELQAGVVSRRQAIARGLAKHDLDRLVRRRLLTPIHPAVFLNHTGAPTWLQQAWAGVLAVGPAVLCDVSALRACEGPGRRISRDDRIHVAVEWPRNVKQPEGVVVHRMRDLNHRALWSTSPPRLRYEEAALDVAIGCATDLDALAVLAGAVQSRRTTADRILVRARSRPWLPRRDWITGVLDDVAQGACSVLEHGYLTRVERPGLASARRQVPEASAKGTVYRDVVYVCGQCVELDGRLFHDTTAQRDADMDRDLEVAAAGGSTVRLSYGQVFDRPCWTASHVSRLLNLRGWSGAATPCGPRCGLGRKCG